MLAISALVLAVAALTAQVAKAPVQPSGQGLVRIDGGTAYTKDLGKGTYRPHEAGQLPGRLPGGPAEMP